MASRRGKDPKVCNGCKVAKSRAEFYPTGKGVSSKCRPCATAAAADRQRRDPESARASCRKYKLKANYGLTLAQFDAMLEAQGGGCAICGTTEPRGMGRFPVDHCHATGRIRGLLCTECNKGLGNFKDDVRLLVRAIAYLQR